MLANAKEQRAETLERVVQLVRENRPADATAMIELFARRYCQSVPRHDLPGRSAEELCGAALAHWEFIQSREPGQAKIRAYNPTLDEDGWQSRHTVIAMINDDMPFLVDSTTAYLVEHGLTVHTVIHPILFVERDATGQIIRFGEEEASDGLTPESCIFYEVDHRTGADTLAAIEAGLAHVLIDVRAAVEAWPATLERLHETATSLEATPPSLPVEELEEGVAFLRWMADNHFTFLGYREYAFGGTTGESATYHIVPESGLGLLRDPSVRPLGTARGPEGLPPEIYEFVRAPRLLMITKAAMHSTVHRTVPMDSIGVKVFDAAGNVVGERRFVGLFTSTAYSSSPVSIPVLRQKVRHALEHSALSPRSHDRKALQHILEALPRDELFQIEVDELVEMSLGILRVDERRRPGLFIRRDPFERFISCLVYVPRERYNTDLRQHIQWILESSLAGVRSSFTVQVSDRPLAMLHFIIEVAPGRIPPYDVEEIETRIVESVRSWSDRVKDRLLARFGEERGNTLYQRYGAAFPAAYREDFPASNAVDDVENLEAARRSHRLTMNLYRQAEQEAGLVNFKIYHAENPIPLSDLLPPLENMGLRVLSERPYRIRAGQAAVGGALISEVSRAEPGAMWIHDLTMVESSGAEIDIPAVHDAFQESFERVWMGDAEDDGFNRLIVRAGLHWREVVVLRAVAKFLRQVGIPFSQAYMEDTLAENPALARKLVGYFIARFSPERPAENDIAALRAAIFEDLDAVESLDQDRILRRYVNVLDSMLRTNFFQPGPSGAPKSYLAFKLDSQALDELPLPRPLVEVFVYSPRVEGLHMRGGKVARGGIRWSDRREDFRTEILGLMKAQMVKNAVIVPVGAKGGFVVKRPPSEGGRDALMEEGIACYKTLISGLLDLADNRSKGGVVPPPAVVRYDDDDPYLVVAADKGTASFSDIANGLAAEYQFWLGDGFASGGHAGYDHKEMGITARGAWESVKRHFRELGRDIQTEDFTVVGVGDMSGDVFGNGMLQSEHIRLLGAFDHRHIFIDPDPDPAASAAERRRLFEIPRVTWADYDPSRISTGGGVFDRRAKSVLISPEARARLGIGRETLTPAELIRALLRAPVDLLWFGGIGCFVKASDEREIDIGDRANEAVRVDAGELHCRVVGDGANLGVTHRGRLEFARAGGAINTDAVDNSAGVDCSDHEVNIKILLNALVADGAMTTKERDVLLADMTDEVATLVLKDNYLQTQAISIAAAEAPELLDSHSRFMRALERRGRLDRTVEFLPNDETLEERQQNGEGLTRPEIAVLLAYAKMTLYADLLESDVPEDPYLAVDLVRYFPAPLRDSQVAAIERHRLRREIIATSVANSLVNRTGLEFVAEMTEETSADVADIVRAYAVARQVFDLRTIWDAIEGLDNEVASDVQIGMMQEAGRLLHRGALWFLRAERLPVDISRAIETYAPGVAALSEVIDVVLAEEERARYEATRHNLADAGVPDELARQIAAVDPLMPACDIVDVAGTTGLAAGDTARVYFALGARLGVDWLRAGAAALITGNHWQHRAVSAIVDDLYGQQRALCMAVLKAAEPSASPGAAIDSWVAGNRMMVENTLSLFNDLKAAGSLDLSMLAVANRQIRTLLVT